MASTNVDILLNAKNNASRQIRQVSGDLGGLGSKGKMAGKAALAATAAIAGLVAATSAVDFSRLAAQTARTAASMDTLAERANTTGDALLGALRQASRGAVADAKLIEGANRAMLLGVADSTDEFTKLMEIARARAAAMGTTTTSAFDDIVTGIGRLSPLILDNLGIVVDSEKVYADYATQIGTTTQAMTENEKKAALLNAAYRDSLDLIAAQAAAGDDLAAGFERMDTAISNAKLALGELFAPVVVAIANALAGGANALADALERVAANQLVINFQSTANALLGVGNAAEEAGIDVNALLVEEERAVKAKRNMATAATIAELGLLSMGMGAAEGAKQTANMRGKILQLARGIRESEKAAKAAGKAYNSAFEELRGKVSSVLGGSLSSGIDLTSLLPRPDAIEEDARRLADVAVKGYNSPWFEYLRNKFPNLLSETGGDVRSQAARILQDFEAGLRPELLDKERAKDRIKKMLLGDIRMGELADEITRELQQEFGGNLSPAAIKATVEAQLGLGAPGAQMFGQLGTQAIQAVQSQNVGGKVVETVRQQVRSERSLALAGQAGITMAGGIVGGITSEIERTDLGSTILTIIMRQVIEAHRTATLR